jgi:hypothetical protein
MEMATTDTVTPSYVASELFDIKTGFAILEETIHGLMSSTRSEEGDSDLRFQALWLSEKLKKAIGGAYDNAVKLDRASS